MYDSSGFEHVFVGETRGANEVFGFHNWIQFYLQEKASHVDYQGYILTRGGDSYSKLGGLMRGEAWQRAIARCDQGEFECGGMPHTHNARMRISQN